MRSSGSKSEVGACKIRLPHAVWEAIDYAAAFAWLPASWRLVVEQGVLYTLFIPAGAVLATLIYYRITAARAAAGLG